MKKILVLASAISIGFIACQKEQPQNEVAQPISFDLMMLGEVTQTEDAKQQWCFPPAKNCLSEVIITAPKPKYFEMLENTVSFSMLQTYANSADGSSLMSEFVTDAMLQNIKDGTHSLIHLPSKVTDGDLFLYGNVEELTEDNFDIAIPVLRPQ